MEEIQRERLYHLLPSIYRIRDKAQGEPLRALMNALENEWSLVEEDIDALYDNWFIETCDEWVIPYLASHVGTTQLEESRKLFPGQRRQVANTIGYRRRKGLRAILEHALADVTGWYIHCVEYDQLLARTQHFANSVVANNPLIDLRHAGELALLNSSFESSAHTIDVRNRGHESSSNVLNSELQGKYRPGNLGIFVWRLRSYPMNIVPARAMTQTAERTLAPGCFTFDPLGRDMPLFNQPQTICDLAQAIEPVYLPMSISRFALSEDLHNYHTQRHFALSEESPFEEDDLLHNSTYYGPDRALCVLVNDAPLLPDAIISADLSQWSLPPESIRGRASRVAIDVVLGRLRFLDASLLKENDVVAVNYSYGFSSDMGGGPYMRACLTPDGARYRVNVLQSGKVSTLQGALSEWENYCRTWEEQHKGSFQGDRPCGTIHIVDNGLYSENELIINLPKNADLVIEASDGVRPVIEA
ncbi:MAG TPA: phage tail protein, partial [Ktedonobacteraceae bacterium]|nr:phage tail protein [Ktedonobacteraceae bacterium]